MRLLKLFSESYIKWEDYSLKLSEFEYWNFISETIRGDVK